jgi:hypothetical protein
VGTAGEIFYDSTNQTLRVYPGNIAAGKILADRDWVNSVGVINYNNLTNRPTLFSGNYADLSNKPILFSGSYADLTNKPVIPESYSFSVSADDSTQRLISTDEVIKFVGAGGITTASDAEGYITITQGTTSSLVNGASTASLGSDGSLQIPGDIKSNGNINIDINLSDSTLRRWQFGEDGNLTLPAGGDILNSSGQPYVNGVTSISSSVSTGIYTDASGDYQYGTLSYDYAVNGVTSGGFSIEYSRPLVGGNVDIHVGNAVVNGDLTLSGDIKSNGNINIDINLADSTLRRWQFGEDGALTFPDGTNQSTAFTGIPGPYADDEAAALAGVALGSPYHKTGTNGQVFVRLTSPT